MRVLVTGASGLLGGRLAHLLGLRFDVIAAHHRSTLPAEWPAVTLDVGLRDSVEAAFETARPDAVLHAAALASTDECERDPERAVLTNVRGSQWIARACAARRLPLVALSTDLVFAGDRELSDEATTAAPLMTYGRTKLEAENLVLASSPLAAVARVALVAGCGFGPRASATEAVAWALRQGRRVTLFADEFRTPVDAESLVPALAALLTGHHTGRFHLGGPERISRYELGLRVARVLGLDAGGIERASQKTWTGTPRPADTSLDSSHARRELGYRPRPLDDVIRDGRLAGAP